MDSEPSYSHRAIAAANHDQRVIKAGPFSPRRRLGHHCALLGLLGAIGVSAFIFSAISPYDDDIQQEFVEGNKAKLSVLPTYKAPSTIRGFRISTVRSALPPRRQLLANSDAIARIFIPHEEIEATIFSSRTGDRSPPARSS